jgi:acyl dehydratase
MRSIVGSPVVSQTEAMSAAPESTPSNPLPADRPPEIYQGLTFDEQPIGTRWRTARRTISETDLITYATMFGFNEALFLDATASEKAGFDGRLVPGSLVMSVAEGLIVSGGSLKGTGLAYL